MDDDRGLLLGDGLFETLLWADGRLHDLEAHVDRMRRGCVVLGLPPPDPRRLEAAAIGAVRAAGRGDRLAVRLSWTAGGGGRGLDRPDAPAPRLVAAASAFETPRAPAALATVAVRRNDQSPTSRIKSLSYLDHVLARREARAVGADEAVQLDSRGRVAGCAAANLFWISDGRLFTPSRECGVLDGVMRGRVIAAATRLGVEVVQGPFAPAALAAAEAAFVTNSLIGLREASALDGRSLAAGHPMTARLSAAA